MIRPGLLSPGHNGFEGLWYHAKAYLEGVSHYMHHLCTRFKSRSPQASVPSCHYSNVVGSKTSFSWSALYFLLPNRFTCQFNITVLRLYLPLPRISINWIWKSKRKMTGGVMFLATRTLTGFKIAFLSPLENPSHFLSLRKSICRCWICSCSSKSEGSSGRIHSRAPSPGQSLKWKENARISRCLNGLVPLISSLTT